MRRLVWSLILGAGAAGAQTAAPVPLKLELNVSASWPVAVLDPIAFCLAPSNDPTQPPTLKLCAPPAAAEKRVIGEAYSIGSTDQTGAAAVPLTQLPASGTLAVWLRGRRITAFSLVGKILTIAASEKPLLGDAVIVDYAIPFSLTSRAEAPDSSTEATGSRAVTVSFARSASLPAASRP